ncbi:glycosyltransferase [Phycicoccus sp. HDW14]|uniref:glycosyltransferase family 2 protein n=1 Tax=Phycicoccus sp. HDW14 TaxID=2714941 RepID=UPI00140CDDFE|nr:glycosyltransferase [Phycicoccus sp. HDW14]QIM21330.1 glycosyltransferase [Phycicoccus sp. HDW14]
MSGTPVCSVVIPTYNGAATIGEQLAALADQTMTEPFEVVVADNGSTDGLAAVLDEWRERLPLLRRVDASRARGVSVARNEGIRAAASDRLLICDADDVVDRDWVRALSSALDEHAFVGGAFETETLSGRSAAWVPVPTRSDGLLEIWGVAYPIGCNTGFRREVFDAVGGYDEGYPPGAEEIDFAWRARLQGYAAAYVPDALHHYRIRTDLRGVLRQQRNSGRGVVALYERFHPEGVRTLSLRRRLHHEALLVARFPWRGPSPERRRWMSLLAFEAGKLAEATARRVRAP